VLSSRDADEKVQQPAVEATGAEESKVEESVSRNSQKEISHV
jgi:hypothetical protein